MDTNNSNNNDNNNIVWRRSVKADDTADSATDDIPVMDINNRTGLHSNSSDTSDADLEIENIKNEINQVLSSDSLDEVQSPKNNYADNLSDNIPQDDLPRTPKANTSSDVLMNDTLESPQPSGDPLMSSDMQSSDLDAVARENHETLVNSLKQDIENEIHSVQESAPEKKMGVGQTYYSDLSTAMGSNEPATMSELIRKSRFEEKEAAVLSPKSQKNIAFIVGSILLLLISIAVLAFVFGKKEKVEFITEQRVSSLVYANMDTGINTTGLDASRIKQAIRDVIEMKIPQDTINQIYYVQDDGIGNLRRLGVKDIFDKTNNETPTILYDNITNDFTHGVYRTDKNYPFIIMKVLSYDRALEGLKEWEPDMIDDLATYMDLPPEATDRSLLKPGFEDDLIKNKNVRVARFLPREVDKRGILDFLGGNNNEEVVQEQESVTSFDEFEDTEIPSAPFNTMSYLERARVIASNFLEPQVYAQQTYSLSGNVRDTYGPLPDVNILITGTSIGVATDINGNYVLNNIPAGMQNIQFSHLGYTTKTQSINQGTQTLDIVLEEDAEELDEVVITTGGSNSGSTTNTNTPPQNNGTDSWNFGNANGNQNTTGTINETTGVVTEPVCFNQLTGQRLASGNPDNLQYGFCFKPYACYRYTCFVGNNDVGPNAQGQPGAICGEYKQGGEVLHKTEPAYNPAVHGTVQSCYQLNGLMAIQNINDAVLCFTEAGDYLPGETLEREGVVCSEAITRKDILCINDNNELVEPSSPGDHICFNPFVPNASSAGPQSTNACKDLTYEQIRQKMAAIAFQLRTITFYASLLGLSDQDQANVNEVSEFLEDVAHGNITQIDAVQQSYAIIAKFEAVLDRIELIARAVPLPASIGGDVDNFYDYIENIIQEIKCVFGAEATIGWVDIQIPQGETVFTGQSSPTVNIVQEALTIIGIMDASSPRGTLDLVTQDAIAQFQTANGLEVTGIIDPETLSLLGTIVDGQGTIFGDTATIEDYFVVTNGGISADGSQILTLGAYNNDVQALQVFLYAEGYTITEINGLFDEEVCLALQEFQEDQSLEIADDNTCAVSAGTLETLNQIILDKNLLGSGYYLNPQGFLTGSGRLTGTFGPGVVDFSVNEADADTLREGDIVLMYMFLDEETILIARDEVVINEVIKRRALSDIFE